MKKSWKNVVNLRALKFENWSRGKAYRGKSAEVARKMGAEKLGFHVETLAAKSFSCPFHYHQAEEELFLVLAGRALVRQGKRVRELIAGDIILFKTGEENAHQFYNHTDEEFRFLAVSNNAEIEVCGYPDSNKILTSTANKKGGRTYSVHSRKALDYWKGEENPAKNWPKGSI